MQCRRRNGEKRGEAVIHLSLYNKVRFMVELRRETALTDGASLTGKRLTPDRLAPVTVVENPVPNGLSLKETI